MPGMVSRYLVIFNNNPILLQNGANNQFAVSGFFINDSSIFIPLFYHQLLSDLETIFVTRQH